RVLLELVFEGEDVADDRGLPPRVELLERDLVEHPRRDLAPLRRREDALAAGEALEHRVAPEQLRREAVIVEDLGLPALVEVERAQRAPDPHDEVLGRL